MEVTGGGGRPEGAGALVASGVLRVATGIVIKRAKILFRRSTLYAAAGFAATGALVSLFGRTLECETIAWVGTDYKTLPHPMLPDPVDAERLVVHGGQKVVHLLGRSLYLPRHSIQETPLVGRTYVQKRLSDVRFHRLVADAPRVKYFNGGPRRVGRYSHLSVKTRIITEVINNTLLHKSPDMHNVKHKLLKNRRPSHHVKHDETQVPPKRRRAGKQAPSRHPVRLNLSLK